MVTKGGGGAAASSSSASSSAAAAAAAAMDASGGGLQRSSAHAAGGNSQGAEGAATAATGNAARDAWYTFDEVKLEEVMSAKAWLQDPRYFKKVRISPSAAMKMLMHACSGVERGMKGPGGKPVEVMGLMIGRCDAGSPTTLVVTDVFPLPVEGAETRVLADDTEVQNYMIGLGESLEQTRKERFMGWYHSHPFSVEVHSNCFLSGTDVQTQLAWQRYTDSKDCPWLAIVVDPLRSLAKNRPEFGAYRVYPPEFTAPSNQVPDGKTVQDDTARVERWGSCWNRYYELEIEYFMSALAASLMEQLTRNFLWMRALATTPALEKENADQLSERIAAVADRLECCAGAAHGHGGGGGGGHGGIVSAYISAAAALGGGGGGGGGGEASSSSSAAAAGGGGGGGRGGKEDSALTKAMRSSCEIALEQCQGQLSQVAKHITMNLRPLNDNNQPPAPAAPAGLK